MEFMKHAKEVLLGALSTEEVGDAIRKRFDEKMAERVRGFVREEIDNIFPYKWGVERDRNKDCIVCHKILTALEHGVCNVCRKALGGNTYPGVDRENEAELNRLARRIVELAISGSAAFVHLPPYSTEFSYMDSEFDKYKALKEKK